MLAPLAIGRRVEREREPLFAPGFLAQIERLRIASLKALVGGLREGHRLGSYKGGQLEFHGHREYSPGDELRYLDWNGYARLGRPFIKEFAREESGVLHLWLDASASMRLGTPDKFTFVRRVAALFAHVALSTQDSVHVCVFSGSAAPEFFPIRHARSNLRDYLAFFERVTPDEFDAGSSSNSPANEARTLTACAADFLKRSPKRGGIILLGDFWQHEEDVAACVSRLTQSSFDAAAIHTLAMEEIEPSVTGEILARGVESSAMTELNFDAEMSTRYATELEKHRTSVESIFKKRGGHYLFAPSNTSIEKVLLATLRQRRWVH